MSNIQIKPDLIELENRIAPIIDKVVDRYVRTGELAKGYQITASKFRLLTDRVLAGDEQSIAYEFDVDLTVGNRNLMFTSVVRDKIQAELSRELLAEKITVVQGDRLEKHDHRNDHRYFRMVFTPATVFGSIVAENIAERLPSLVVLGGDWTQLFDDSSIMARAVWKEDLSPYWFLPDPLDHTYVRNHFHKATYFNDWMMVMEASNAILADMGLEILRMDTGSVLLSLKGFCPDLVKEDKRWAAALYDRDTYGMEALGPYLPEEAMDFLFPYAEHLASTNTWGQFFKAIRLRGLVYPMEDRLMDGIIEEDREFGFNGRFQVQFQLLHSLIYNDNFREAYRLERRSMRLSALREMMERTRA